MCANLSVPAQHRFGLYNEERGLPAAEPATRQNPETTVHILKARPRPAALQDYQLLPEAKIVRDQQCLWLDSRSKRPQQTAKHCLCPCCRTATSLMPFNAVNGNGPCGSQFCALQVLDRGEHDVALVRIVWRGGAITEIHVKRRVSSVANLSRGEEMRERVLELARTKMHHDEIAAVLTSEGHRSPNCADKV